MSKDRKSSCLPSTTAPNGSEVPVTEPPVGTYAFTARLMAQAMPVDDDPDFWDRWKDEMKDRDLD